MMEGRLYVYGYHPRAFWKKFGQAGEILVGYRRRLEDGLVEEEEVDDKPLLAVAGDDEVRMYKS
jgi:hypothetical protein